MNTILIAAIYGSLAGGHLVKAPNIVDDEGEWKGTATLTEERANAHGWKLVEDFPPATASNEVAVAVGWAETNRIYRVYEINVVTPPPRKLSKLKIYGTLASLDQVRGTANGATWDAVKAWLEAKDIGGVNGWMAFQLAQEVSEDHPLFAPLAAEAKQLLGLTDAQFEAFLNACILED